MNIGMGAPKVKKPKPIAPQAQMVDLQAEGESGASNFEAELKKKRKQSQTTMAGETGGYGGGTKLG
jgi:hypothetical protein